MLSNSPAGLSWGLMQGHTRRKCVGTQSHKDLRQEITWPGTVGEAPLR